MPDSLLDSGSEFDRAKSLLGRWLRQRYAVQTIQLDELSAYSDHTFIAGWRVQVEHSGEAHIFHVLIDGGFPYSPIRLAYKSCDQYLKWPHVEKRGLLCLPRRPAPCAGIEEAIAGTLADGLTLTEQCRDANFVADEFRREFRSYWDHAKNDQAKPLRSLLSTTNRKSRRVAVWFGTSYTLVGESVDQVKSWLRNTGRTEESGIEPGIFAFLEQAPVPPYPDRPSDLFGLMQKHAPDAVALMGGVSTEHAVAVVLGSNSRSGVGLIGATLSSPRDFNGFRKGARSRLPVKLALWKVKSDLARAEVTRFDAGWVHGRGLNKHQPTTEAATVLVLGCGSLGSQVAVRLAQSGVGGIVLVDPETLTAANVGRHALGIGAVNLNKAAALGAELRNRFPHMRRIETHPVTWQSLYRKNSEIFSQASLILACLGEWSADGPLGELQARGLIPQPVVYSWLDEFGTAAHAVALSKSSPSLPCLLDGDGALRVAETSWNGEGLIQAEPACGTLFQPYGALDVAQAEALAGRLCIDLLTGDAKTPCHRVYAGTTAQLTEAGGMWSSDHLKHRPTGFDGAFTYERAVSACGKCPTCQSAR